MKFCLFFLFFAFSINVIGQTTGQFTGEEKAYMHHMVMKSPILRSNIGRYFEYSGPKVFLTDTIVNYDSLDVLIMNDPSLLVIRTSEIAKSPPGIVLELANKMAVWELNKTLLAYKQNDEEDMLRYRVNMEQFEALLVPKLPYGLVQRTPEGRSTFSPKLHKVLNPSLSFSEKVTMLGTFPNLALEDQKIALDAMNEAVNAWVKSRTQVVFNQLGGKTTKFENVLIAAGDGSMTSGMLNEREKDEQGRWNRGLPRAVGLFPYQSAIVTPAERKKPEIQPERYVSMQLATAGNNRITNIHADVWGYNDKKQTTVVIEKGRYQYVLFGSGDTRFLSPDSTFSEGKTFYSLINELKNKWIKDIREMIYGKKGFDFWIAHWESELEKTKMNIKKAEVELSSLRMSDVSLSKSGKKSRKSQQECLLQQYAYKDECEANIKNLKKEKENAMILLADYERRLEKYQQLIGLNWVKWKEKDGLYSFEDGATFDLYTQEFRFPPHRLSEQFEIRLLAIPFTALSDQADEVMLHVSVSDMEPGFDRTIQLVAEDLFHPNMYNLENPLFTDADSLAIVDLLDVLMKKPAVEIIARGQGVGEWQEGKLVKQHPVFEEAFYPGVTDEDKQKMREDSTYKSRRRSELFVDTRNGIQIEVNAYTDPVRTDFMPAHPVLAKLREEKKITGNEALSVYRAATLLKKFQEELNVLAGRYLPREKASIVIDHLNKQFQKARVSVGSQSVGLGEL
jgi:hypothetical protein